MSTSRTLIETDPKGLRTWEVKDSQGRVVGTDREYSPPAEKTLEDRVAALEKGQRA